MMDGKAEYELWREAKCKLHLGLDECHALLQKIASQIDDTPLQVHGLISRITESVCTIVTEAMNPLRGYTTLSALTEAQRLIDVAVVLCHANNDLTKLNVS
jgi:hypothetical protein